MKAKKKIINPLSPVEMVNIELKANPGFDRQHYTSLTTD